MSEPVTREEMNARLEAAEARTETRFVQLVGKIDALGGQIAQVRQDLGGQIIQVRQELGQVRQDLGGQVAEVRGNLGGQMAEFREDLSGRMAEVLADNKSTRQTIMWVTITAMLTVIAVVIAVQVGLMNAFSAGVARREAGPAAAYQPAGLALPAVPPSSQAPASTRANTTG